MGQGWSDREVPDTKRPTPLERVHPLGLSSMPVYVPRKPTEHGRESSSSTSEPLESERGQTLSASTSKPAVNIIFLHEIGQGCENTWVTEVTDDGPAAFWPMELPEEILSAAHMHVYEYGPDPPLDLMGIVSAKNLESEARGLLEAIRKLEKERPFFFVAHGFGGLICEQALVLASGHDRYSHILKLTWGIILFGTPQFLAGLGEWALISAKKWGISTEDTPQRQNWEPYKDDLQRISAMQKEFWGVGTKEDAYDARKDIEVVSCFEALPVAEYNLMIAPEWAIVPRGGAISIPADHFSMTKSGPETKDGLKRVSDQLSQWISDVKESLMHPYEKIDDWCRNGGTASTFLSQVAEKHNKSRHGEDQFHWIRNKYPMAGKLTAGDIIGPEFLGEPLEKDWRNRAERYQAERYLDERYQAGPTSAFTIEFSKSYRPHRKSFEVLHEWLDNVRRYLSDYDGTREVTASDFNFGSLVATRYQPSKDELKFAGKLPAVVELVRDSTTTDARKAYAVVETLAVRGGPLMKKIAKRNEKRPQPLGDTGSPTRPHDDEDEFVFAFKVNEIPLPSIENDFAIPKIWFLNYSRANVLGRLWVPPVRALPPPFWVGLGFWEETKVAYDISGALRSPINAEMTKTTRGTLDEITEMMKSRKFSITAQVFVPTLEYIVREMKQHPIYWSRNRRRPLRVVVGVAADEGLSERFAEDNIRNRSATKMAQGIRTKLPITAYIPIAYCVKELVLVGQKGDDVVWLKEDEDEVGKYGFRIDVPDQPKVIGPDKR